MSEKRRTRGGQPTLTAGDWAEAALQLLAERGVAALTVDALAARLGVTKGSFYWHFADRAALLQAALERWERRSTDEAAAALAAIADPHRRLDLLFGAWLQAPRSRSLYVALSGATDDPAVGAALRRVATRRVEFLARTYRETGLDPGAAADRALLTYSAYLGLLQVAAQAPGLVPAGAALERYRRHVRERLLPRARRGRS
jgi:AcrR family transcriptional regulator